MRQHDAALSPLRHVAALPQNKSAADFSAARDGASSYGETAMAAALVSAAVVVVVVEIATDVV